MERLLEVLKNTLPTIEFGDGNNLISGGIIDSLGVISIVMALSDEYGITLDPDDISVENFNSVESIRKLVEKKQMDS